MTSESYCQEELTTSAKLVPHGAGRNDLTHYHYEAVPKLTTSTYPPPPHSPLLHPSPTHLDASRVEQMERHGLCDDVEEGAGVSEQLVDQQEVHVAGLEQLGQAATEGLVDGPAGGRPQLRLREHVLAGHTPRFRHRTTRA